MSEEVEVVEVVEKPRNPIWLGLGFTAIPALVLALGYLNVHPEIYRGIPAGFGGEQTSATSGIAWADDERDSPPLKFHSDSF